MNDPTPIRESATHQPVWLVCALTAVSVALFVAWLLFGDHLPWWASSLTLAGSVIASLEAVHLARKAGAA